MSWIRQNSYLQPPRNQLPQRPDRTQKITNYQAFSAFLVIIFHENRWYRPPKIELYEKFSWRRYCKLRKQSDFNRIQWDCKRFAFLLQRRMRALQLKWKQEFGHVFVPSCRRVSDYWSRYKPNKRLSSIHDFIPLLFMRKGNKAGWNNKDILFWRLW